MKCKRCKKDKDFGAVKAGHWYCGGCLNWGPLDFVLAGFWNVFFQGIDSPNAKK